MTVNGEVKVAIAQKKLVLFAGAGVSMNLGLPSWSGLIDKMAGDVGFDPALFQAMGEFDALAEFYEIEKGGRLEIVDWMRREWQSSTISTLTSEIHDLIVRCNFPVIYTTNYDHWLEQSYIQRGSSCSTIIDVRDLPKLTEPDPCVVKFHGDLGAPETMVLTESDYAKRMSLESALDIQLRSDTLQRGILFLGYSLRDKNLRYILHKLKQLRDGFAAPSAYPPSYLFTNRVNHVEEKLLSQWGVKVIVPDELEPSTALQEFLRSVV
ncbi:SIR2 family protein [Shimia aestuarii]|uniref:SIR2 family protein n=1 Tax=Shimia aestuarii TaxID=254406 RepID=UPI001FB46C8C|nr:SIR2 family protein [Shimia aestuarii]